MRQYYTNIDEYLESINKEQQDIKTIQKNIKNISKESIKTLLFKANWAKEDLKRYKRELKNRIKTKRQYIKKIKTNLTEISTFKINNAYKFLKEALNLLEENKYIITEFEIKKNLSYIPIGKQMVKIENKTDKKIYMIATKENTKKILNPNNYNILEETLKSKEYLLIEGNKNYSFIDEETLKIKEEITNFNPNLEKIITNLINLRIKKQILTEHQLMKITLEDIKPTQKIKTKKCK